MSKQEAVPGIASNTGGTAASRGGPGVYQAFAPGSGLARRLPSSLVNFSRSQQPMREQRQVE